MAKRRSYVVGPMLVLAFVSACKPPPADVTAPVAEPVAMDNKAIFAEAAPITPQCKATTVGGSLGLIPEGADMLVHLSPTAIARSSLWQVLEPALAQSPEWAEVFSGCGMQVEEFEHLLVGARQSDEAFVAVVAGQGIGRPDRAQCVITAIQRSAGDEQAAQVETSPDDPNTLIIQFTDGRAFLLGENLLAVATTAWEDDVARLARCQDVGAVQRSLLDPMRAVDLGAPVWFAARPWPEIVDLLASSVSELGQMSSASANMYLDSGMEISAHVELGDPQTAASLASTLQGFIQMFAVGAPQGLTDVAGRMRADAAGSGVDMRVMLTVDELRMLGAL